MVVHLTGGAGFIGRHLARELTACGHTVSCSGRNEAFVPWAALKLGLPDVVVHLGAVGKHKDARTTFLFNVASTAEWARYCSEVDVRFIYVTTYEPPSTSLYSLSKAMGSDVTRFYFGEGYRRVRLGPVYGAGSGSAPMQFLRAAWAGARMQVVAGASRCYLHIDDAVWALRKLIEDDVWAGTARVGQSSERWSMLAIARLCCGMFGRDEDDLIEEIPLPDGFVEYAMAAPWEWPDHPFMSLEEGLGGEANSLRDAL